MLFSVIQDNERMNQWTNLSVMKRFKSVRWIRPDSGSVCGVSGARVSLRRAISPQTRPPDPDHPETGLRTSAPDPAPQGSSISCTHNHTESLTESPAIPPSVRHSAVWSSVTHTHTRSLQEVLSADVPHRFLRFTQNRQNMQELLIRERRRAAVSLHDPGEKKQNTLIQSFMNIWLHTKIPLY